MLNILIILTIITEKAHFVPARKHLQRCGYKFYAFIIYKKAENEASRTCFLGNKNVPKVIILFKMRWKREISLLILAPIMSLMLKKWEQAICKKPKRMCDFGFPFEMTQMNSWSGGHEHLLGGDGGINKVSRFKFLTAFSSTLNTINVNIFPKDGDMCRF